MQHSVSYDSHHSTSRSSKRRACEHKRLCVTSCQEVCAVCGGVWWCVRWCVVVDSKAPFRFQAALTSLLWPDRC